MKHIQDQTIFITGSTDGLGKAIALNLAKQGATLLLHGKSEEKGLILVDEIKSETGNNNVKYYNSDFSSLQSVRNLGAMIENEYQNLDIVINNAGIDNTDEIRRLSAEHYELSFAINYLAPFLLTNMLLPLLQ